MADRSKGWMDFTSERDRQAAELTGPAKMEAEREKWRLYDIQKKEESGD